MQLKFTEQALRALSVPDGVRDQQWFDTSLPSFGFRKFTSGQAAYFVRYRIGRKQRKVTLSKYTPGILAQMRRRAVEILAEARRGHDAVAKTAQTEEQTPLLLGEAVRIYLDARKSEVDPKWFTEISRFLQRYWASYHNRPLASLQRGELVRELDKIARSHGRVTADHTRLALSALFSWAVDRGYAAANPLYRIKRKRKARGRERVLSIRELVAVWHAAGGENDFGRIVRLLILTLQRRAEIGDLQVPEIDMTREQQVTFPSARVKNNRQHAVPLSKPAQDILRSQPRQIDRLFLFGDGQRGFQGWSKAKKRLDIATRRILDAALITQIETEAGDLSERGANKKADETAKALGYDSVEDLLYAIMPQWTLHDLRRTGATLMNDHGIADPHIIEAILNHVSGDSKGGVAGIYNRASYEIQKRVALDKWADFLLRAVHSFESGGLSGVDDFVAYARQQLHIA